MVTQQWIERRDKAACALTRIKELAAQVAVDYGSSKVERDIRELEYGLESVCECLGALREDDFIQAERYTLSGLWFDVYMPWHRGPRNYLEHLYIKLKLNSDCTSVVLCSFHLSHTHE